MNRRHSTLLPLVLTLLALAGCKTEREPPALPPAPADGDQGTDDGQAPLCTEEVRAVGPAPARLLTRYEYRNTVRDLLGVTPDVTAFPPENEAHGWENDALTHVASPALVRHLTLASETIAAEAVGGRLEALLPCDVAEVGEMACGAMFVEAFGARAFRRPLAEAERQIFLDVFQDELGRGGLAAAVEATIELALQSPQFLYRIEAVGPEAGPGEIVAVDDRAMASRLSYFLWGTMPDATLFAAAERGELSTPAQLEAQARRMLADERARETVVQFHRQWLGLDVLEDVVKDTSVYPGYDEGMPADWRASLDAFVLHVAFGEEGGTLGRLLSDESVFLTPRLAPFYGQSPRGEGLARYELAGEPRAGLLTQPGLMAMLAYADQGSPIHRGVFVRERVLCQPLMPPPADAAIVPPDPDPSATTRERFAQHTASDECAGCHSLIDPIGFGFEHYDGVGRYRATESGKPVDASGALTAMRDRSLNGPYEGADALAARLATSDEVADCYARQWMTYAMGRPPSEAELCGLQRVQARFDASGGDIRELLVAIVLSEPFRFVRVPEGGE